jgi:hypothetical protein
MTYAARTAAFQQGVAPYRRPAEAAPQPGFLTRLVNAIFASRQRHAERDVEAYLARTGQRFTDSVEREINEHLFAGGWTAHR